MGLEFAMKDYHEKGIKASTTQSSFILISHAKLEEILKNEDAMTSDIFLNFNVKILFGIYSTFLSKYEATTIVKEI